MPTPLIRDVSDTAFMVAAQRAIESNRKDALFHDPLAGLLAGQRGRDIVASSTHQKHFGYWFVVLRTVIIDDFIQSAIAQGTDTILNLGAGLDTRPYRLDLPKSLQWVEVDYPHVIEYKQSRLADQHPHPTLQRFSLDLADIWARRALFADINNKAKKVLVLTEGVVPYLTTEQAASLADDLRSKPHFTNWIVDYFAPQTLSYRRSRHMRHLMENAPFLFEPTDYFEFFAEHGWKQKEIRYTADEATRRHRPITAPLWLKLLWVTRALFASPARRQAFRKLTAYVLFEPTSRQ